jgi:hypothetical protein
MKATSLLIACLLLCSMPTANLQAPEALLLFGGQDHEDFLGCLNCVDSSPASVYNDLGKYGSSLNSNSIWNSLGKYGSSLSQYSPHTVPRVRFLVDRITRRSMVGVAGREAIAWL